MKKLSNSLFLASLLSLFLHGAASATEVPGSSAGNQKDALPKFVHDYAPGYPGQRRNRIRPPAGYSAFMTFLENGVFDPQVPHPEVPGCFAYFCSGDYFHVTVMGRSLAQVLAIELDAKLFFATRFGVDVDDPANAGKLFLRRYYRDPRSNLNAYLVSRRSVPTAGWRVDDGGWQLIFLEDYPLGGDFAGETVPPGTILTWGEYLITPDRRRAGRPIVISHRSAIPPFSRVTATERFHAFQDELYRGALDDPDNDWGNPSFARQGLDQGVEFNPLGTGGEVTANARHVLTFSADGGL